MMVRLNAVCFISEYRLNLGVNVPVLLNWERLGGCMQFNYISQWEEVHIHMRLNHAHRDLQSKRLINKYQDKRTLSRVQTIKI